MPSRFSAFRKKLGLIHGIRLYSHFKSRNTFPIRLPGVKHPLYFRGKVSDARMFEQIFIDGQYDIKIKFEPKVIIDLGANVGYASVLFANRYPQAKIFAIEPDEDNYQTALKNLSPYSNITLVKGAVWHIEEDINVVDNGYGEAGYMINAGRGTNMVKGYTIAQIMEVMGVSNIDILKIDIEGTEKEIFERGAEAWIPFTKIIMIETHDRYKKGTSKAVFKTIGEYDFSLEINGENLILSNNKLIEAY